MAKPKTITATGYVIDNSSYDRRIKIKSYSVKKAVKNANYGYRLISGKKSYLIDENDKSKIVGYLLKYKTIKIKSRLTIKPFTRIVLKVDKDSVKRNIINRYSYELKDKKIRAYIQKEMPDISAKELKTEIEKRKKQIRKQRNHKIEAELANAGNEALYIIRRRLIEFGNDQAVMTKNPDETIFIDLSNVNKRKVKSIIKVITKVGGLNFHLAAEDLMNMLPSKYVNNDKFRIINKKSKQAVIRFFKKKKIYFYDVESKQSMAGKKYGLYPKKETDDLGKLKLIGYLILENQAKIKSRHLADVNVGYYSQMGRPEVDFELTAEGGKVMSKVSINNLHKRIAIVFDRGILTAPVIESQIGTRARISMGGTTSLDEVKQLVAVLKAGILPGNIKIMKVDHDIFYAKIEFIRPFK